MTPQLYNNTYKIVQAGDTVAIWVEMVHDVRVVRIGGKHRTDGVTPWMGDSIGWWDGDTLVVETTNYNPKQNLRGGDENMKVTERFTRVAADRLLYQFKVEDPTVWSAAMGRRIRVRRRAAASMSTPVTRATTAWKTSWPAPARKNARRRLGGSRRRSGRVQIPISVIPGLVPGIHPSTSQRWG